MRERTNAVRICDRSRVERQQLIGCRRCVADYRGARGGFRKISNRCCRLREYLFKGIRSIRPAYRNADLAANFLLSQREAGASGTDDVGPGHAINRFLPLIGRIDDTIGIGNARDIGREDRSLHGDNIIQHGLTCRRKRSKHDRKGRFRDQLFRRLGGQVGKPHHDPQLAANFRCTGRERRGSRSGHVVPDHAIGRSLPLIGQLAHAVRVRNGADIDRQFLSLERREIADHRRTRRCLGQIGNWFGSNRSQRFERTRAIRPECLDPDRQANFGLCRHEAVGSGLDNIHPGHTAIGRSLPLVGRIDDAVRIDDAGHVDRQQRTFADGADDRRSTSCRHGDHVEQVISNRSAIAVRELQLFDVEQTVGAFADVYCTRIIGDRRSQHPVVGDRDTAIGIEHEAVCLPGVAIDRRVDVTSLAAVENFANDLELARVQRTVQDQLINRLATKQDVAVQIGNLSMHVVCGRKSNTVGVVDADANVEPAVTVDHVVTSLAGNEVVAATAKHDLVRTFDDVRGHTVSVTDQIGVIKHDNVIGLAVLIADSVAGQVVHQQIKPCDPVHAFLGQRVADREEGGIGARNCSSTDNTLAKNDVAAKQRIVERPTRNAFDKVKAVAQNEVSLRQIGFDGQTKIDLDAQRVFLGDAPVEARHAVGALDAQTLEHDVIARFTVIVGIVAATVEHVVTDNRAVEEKFRVIAGQSIETVSAFSPIVTFTSGDKACSISGKNKVTAFTAKDSLAVAGTGDEVLTVCAERKVKAFAEEQGVIAFLSVDNVACTSGSAEVRQDVIAKTTGEVIDAKTAFKIVVASVTPQGIVASAGNQRVIARSTAEDHVCITRVTQVVVHAVSICVLADHRRIHRFEDGICAGGVIVTISAKAGVLAGLIHFKDVVRRVHQRIGNVGGFGVAKIGRADRKIGPGVGFQLVQQVQALRTAEVVEAVTILQLFHLHFENEGEGGTEHAAERHLHFSKAADPEINHVKAGFRRRPSAGSVQEVRTICRCAFAAEDHVHGSRALGLDRRSFEDRCMLAIGCDEVDHRSGGLEVQRKVEPAFIGLECGVAGLGIEIGAGCVQRRHAGITAAGDVERAKVERQADQVVAQGTRHEFIDFVAGLARHATDDRARSCFRVHAAGIPCDRVEEGLDEANLLAVDRLTVDIETVDRFVEHRVTKTIDDVSELRRDSRIDIDRVREDERINSRGNRAGEVFEHQVLVDLFGCEAAGGEQALTVPVERCQVSRHFSDRHVEPLVDEGKVAAGDDFALDLFDAVVVFAMEHRVDCGQADVLVAAAITNDEVAVEQFVVVGCAVNLDIAGVGVCIGRLARFRSSGMGDVHQERVPRRNSRAGKRGRSRIAFGKDIASKDELREAVRTRNEVAVKVSRDQRNVINSHIRQFDTQHGQRLRLHIGPGRRSTSAASQQVSGCLRLAINQLVFANKDLMGFV